MSGICTCRTFNESFWAHFWAHVQAWSHMPWSVLGFTWTVHMPYAAQCWTGSKNAWAHAMLHAFCFMLDALLCLALVWSNMVTKGDVLLIVSLFLGDHILQQPSRWVIHWASHYKMKQSQWVAFAMRSMHCQVTYCVLCHIASKIIVLRPHGQAVSTVVQSELLMSRGSDIDDYSFSQKFRSEQWDLHVLTIISSKALS